MIVLINDANILIDMLKVGLLDEFVKLEHEMCVPDLVSSEVNEDNVDVLQGYFKSNAIVQESFTYQELTEIQLLEVQHGSLSVPDCSWQRKNLGRY